MRASLPFQLNRGGVLVAVISGAFAGEAGAVAGWVDFTAGNASVLDGQGRQRSLTKGDNLDKGDTVRTGENGRAQIRFTDGAYVSLQPNTEFAIKDYNFEGKTDGSERGFFSLARGAMRTVTGLIGRVNRNRYQVSTPTATIGIRGTGGLIAVLTDGSTLVNGTSGIWTLTNPKATIDVPAGVSGKAPSTPDQPPQQTTEKPQTGPTQPTTTQTTYTQADQRTETGATEELCGSGLVTNCTTSGATIPPNPNPPLVSGPGYHVSYAYGDSSQAGVGGALGSANFNTTGQLQSFTASPKFATFSGTHQEFGTAGGVIAWGRWIGPITGFDVATLSLNPSATQGYHYVVGIPATAMPLSGPGVFAFMGATTPTGKDGTLTGGTFTGTLSVTNWATGAMAVGGTVAFTGPMAFSHSFNTSTGVTFSPGSAAFSGSTTMPINMTAPTGYICSGGCVATVNGAFFGAGASYAGFAYRINGFGAGSTETISGSATFKQ